MPLLQPFPLPAAPSPLLYLQTQPTESTQSQETQGLQPMDRQRKVDVQSVSSGQGGSHLVGHDGWDVHKIVP